MGRRAQRAGSFWRRLVRRDQELGSSGASSSDRARARTISQRQEGLQPRGESNGAEGEKQTLDWGWGARQ